MDRRQFLQAASAAVALGTCSTVTARPPESGQVEWRNKQSGMAYRRLGRTGMMVSEIGSGGDPIRPDNYEHLNLALEKGLNYFDMAPAYGRGECEAAYGKLLASSAKRERVFLTTKISGFRELRNQMYQDIFAGLPAEQQNAIVKRSQDRLHDGGATKPGLLHQILARAGPRFRPFLPQQRHDGRLRTPRGGEPKIPGTYSEFRGDQSETCRHRLLRHRDVPGICTAEELRIPEIQLTFDRLKKKARCASWESHRTTIPRTSYVRQPMSAITTS